MIKVDETGLGVLQFESKGRIRRIPAPVRGTSARGDWKLSNVLLECFDDGVEGSAQLLLTTFDDYLSERIEEIGIGKDVKVTWHVHVREKYDRFSSNNMLDSIEMLTEGENFLINRKEVKHE